MSTSNQGESDATILRAVVTPHVQTTPSLPPQPTSVPPIPPPVPVGRNERRKRGWFIALVVVLLVVLVGGGLGTFFVFSARTPGRAIVPSANQVVGHAFFISSGQIKESSSQGITDELQIDLTHIADPPLGKSYYAWLLADKGMNMAAPLLVGKLAVTNGQVHFLYPGDPNHTNLLETMSRFHITTEDANLTPLFRHQIRVPGCMPLSFPNHPIQRQHP